MQPKQEGQVAHVVSDRQVVINLGSEHGVTMGSQFLVFRPDPNEQIRDPETGLILGTLEIVRGRGKVVHVQPKMATLRSSETQTRKIVRKNPLLGYAEESFTDVTELPFDSVELGDHVRLLR